MDPRSFRKNNEQNKSSKGNIIEKLNLLGESAKRNFSIAVDKIKNDYNSNFSVNNNIDRPRFFDANSSFRENERPPIRQSSFGMNNTPQRDSSMSPSDFPSQRKGFDFGLNGNRFDTKGQFQGMPSSRPGNNNENTRNKTNSIQKDIEKIKTLSLIGLGVVALTIYKIYKNK